MKKRVLVVLLTFVLLMPFIKVKAGNMDSYVDWNLDKSVFAHKIQNGTEHINNLAMMTVNGKIAYCIEPGIDANKGSYYSSTTNIYDTNLSWVNTKKLSLIGYYGYGYPGHEVKEYYMAAQELIWREMGVGSVWWTDAKVGGNNLNIDYYKNEILRLVNNYEIAPEFDFKDKYMVGDEFSISDKNNVLDGYELINNESVSINGNSLNIKVKDKDNNFILRRKQNGKTTMYYYKEGYQTIGTFEFPYNYEKSYNINHFYGKIIVDKLDFDTNSKEPLSSEATLEGAEYGLYDKDGNLLQTKKTDENGKVEFDNLTKNNYTIKEITPSKGYTVDEWTSKTFVGTGTREVTIKSYEKIIKNKIFITKVLDDIDSKTCTPEEGILFGVYDINGKLVTRQKTDKNGNITLELPYGKYVLKQESTFEGIDKVKDKEFEVTVDGVTQSIALVNHRLPEPVLPVIEKQININKLPNTGKNNILNIILLISFCLIGLIYEKKTA